MADLKRQVGKQYGFSVDNFQGDAINIFNRNSNPAPEEDRDDIAHGSLDQDREKIVERLADVVLISEKEFRVNLKPEEDMDDLFHNHIPKAGPYPRHGDAAVPDDLPSQENHRFNGKAEVDLDFLFHK